MAKKKQIIKKSLIEDIFNGEYLNIWKDEDGFYYFQTHSTTLHLDKKEWLTLKKDFIDYSIRSQNRTRKGLRRVKK